MSIEPLTQVRTTIINNYQSATKEDFLCKLNEACRELWTTDERFHLLALSLRPLTNTKNAQLTLIFQDREP